MMGDRLLTPTQMIAEQRQRRRAVSLDRPQLLRRTLEEQSVDERNIERASAVYFDLAMDRAVNHEKAAPMLGELFTMQLQETALRDAADMVAARIRAGMRARTPAPGQ